MLTLTQANKSLKLSTKESTFSRWVVKVLREAGWFVQRIESPVSPGLPDILAIREGYLVWIELKVHPNTLSPAQKSWHETFLKMGGNVETLTLLPDKTLKISNRIFTKKEFPECLFTIRNGKLPKP